MAVEVKVRRLVGLLPGPPVPLAVQEAAVAECGCAAFVGRRVDNGEVATGAAPCSSAHEFAMANFAESLRISVVADPQDRPLIEVCAEMLASELEAVAA